MTKNTQKFVLLTGLVCLGVLAFLAINPIGIDAATKCSGGNCFYVVCQTNSDCGTSRFTGNQQCDGNNIYQDYITYTCNSPGTADASCIRTTTSRHQQSCASDQSCVYGTCVQNARNTVTNSNVNYLKCAGNAVYWFDNIGNQKQLYQTCNSNQTCSGNACVAPTYISRALKGCVNNSVYWYNSLGAQQDIYQNCSLSGQVCQNGACVATQPTYAQPATYVKPATATVTTITQVVKSDKLSVSLLGKNSADATNWSKEINASSNQTINFLVAVKNISDSKMDNVSFKIETAENLNAENVKIDNVQSTKNIYSVITLGGIEKGASKIISFDGALNAQNNGIKITATANSGEAADSDFLTINIAKSSVATASLVDSPFMSFVKKWYLWVIGIIVLISLFVIIFRRLSSNNA